MTFFDKIALKQQGGKLVGKVKKKRKASRIICDILVTLVVIGLLGMAGWLLYNEMFPNNTPVIKAQATQKIGDANEVNFDVLKTMNPDTVGWLTIKNTSIDTPIVQTTDNDLYLYQDFWGKYDERGVPFVDMDYVGYPQNNAVVIYGHSTMNSGVKVLFDDLLNYVKDPTFIKDHGTIIYDRPEESGGKGEWEIFGVVQIEAVADYRQMAFASDAEFIQYFKNLREASIVKNDVIVEPGDEILTLSTCIFNTHLEDGRLAIFAKRIK